jgi:hypothetical protein
MARKLLDLMAAYSAGHIAELTLNCRDGSGTTCVMPRSWGN